MFSITTATKKISSLSKRIRVVAGGTSASKTISILLIIIDLCQTDKEPKLTSVVSESMPHLKRGAMRDFLEIMKQHGYYDDARWNRTDSIYTFETGSQVEFFGVDQSDKLRGARRDRLFINECNNVPFNAYNELEVRTREIVWMDYNPTNEFWFYNEILPNKDMDVDFITVTYKDNEALDKQTVMSIESRRKNIQWFRVYGEGKLGEHEDRVYKGWEIIDEVPFMARLSRRGLDFGYSNDPTAIVDVYEYNGGLILDEALYQKGMLNKAIADYINNLKDPRTLIIADSAEPKSIAELKQYGLTVLPAEKGKDSVNQGIQLVQDKNIQITKSSINLIKEYRNYLWKRDKEGNAINVPEDINNHLMDALRYAISSMNKSTHAKPHKPQAMLSRKYKV